MNIFILCGVPASGKSTWAKQMQQIFGGAYISRDEVRFSIITDEDSYFSKEKEVYNEFVNRICDACTKNENVFCDATHLNFPSRVKLINALRQRDLFNKVNARLIGVNFLCSYLTCATRNNKREGRARVPDSSLQSMFESFVPCSKSEKIPYSFILEVTT